MQSGPCRDLAGQAMRWLAALGCALALPGMSDAQTTSAPARFEFLHLWVDQAEANALRAISDPMRARGVIWSENIVASNFLGVRSAFAKRLALGIPPDGLFWIGGDEATEMHRSGVFRSVPDRNGDWVFSQQLIPEISDLVQLEDRLTVLPLGIHLQNRMIYNADIARRLGISPPGSWQALLDAAPYLAGHGIRAISLSDEPWQLRFLITALLSEHLSADEMRALLDSRRPARSFAPQLTRMVAVFLALRPYADQNSYDLNWASVVENVANGTSFTAFLGDFVAPKLPFDGSVHCTAAPDNDYVVWSFDTIALIATDDPAVIAGQDMLIATLIDPQTQMRYIRRKGGVPVYRHAMDPGRLDPCSAASLRSWQMADEKVLLSVAGWAQSLNVMASLMRRAWRDPEARVAGTVAGLIDALDALNASPREGPGP